MVCLSYTCIAFLISFYWIFPKHFLSFSSTRLPLYSYFIRVFNLIKIHNYSSKCSWHILPLHIHVTFDLWGQTCADILKPWMLRRAVDLSLARFYRRNGQFLLRWWVGFKWRLREDSWFWSHIGLGLNPGSAITRLSWDYVRWCF